MEDDIVRPSPVDVLFTESSRLPKLHIYLRPHIPEENEIINNSYLKDVLLKRTFDVEANGESTVHELHLQKPKSWRPRQLIQKWEEIKETIKKLLIKREEENNVFIIGNGGAGIAGMIAFVACRNPNHLFVWSADHSMPNFRFSNTLHAAITYEPNIEEYLQQKKEIWQPITIFENSFQLVLPPEGDDRLNIAVLVKELETITINSYDETKPSIPNWSKLELSSKVQIDSRRIIGLAFFIRFFEDLYAVHTDTCSGSCMDKWTQCYATRYNHSAMGENDKLIFILGAMTFINFIKYNLNVKIDNLPYTEYAKLNDLTIEILTKMLLIPNYQPNMYSLLLDRILDIWESTATIRNPTWFPNDVMDYALQNNVYHCNDTAFLHNSMQKLRQGMHIDDKQLEWSTPDNPSGKVVFTQTNNNVELVCYHDVTLAELSDEAFLQKDLSQVFKSKRAFVGYMDNVSMNKSRQYGSLYKYIRIKNGNTPTQSISFTTLFTIPDEKIVKMKYPISNFAQLWSPTNVEEEKKNQIQEFFNVDMLQKFNEIKCVNKQLCAPFKEPPEFQTVKNYYLKAIRNAIHHLGKYYLVEWVFGQYEAMDDFLAEVVEGNGNETVQLCYDPNDPDEYEPCFKKMTREYFDKCYNPKDPKKVTECTRAEEKVRDMLVFIS